MTKHEENAMFNRNSLFVAASLALAFSMNFTDLPAYAAQLPDNSTLGTGAPLMKGLGNHGKEANQYLADLIHTSLLRDASGNSKLDEAQCRLDGSCATPNTYLYGITKKHPKAAERLKNVAQLEIYIRGLTKTLLSGDAEWFSARMIGDVLDLTSGFHRKVAVGEEVYQDTQTGEYIFLGNCGNVMWPAPAEATEVAVTATCTKVRIKRPAGATGYRYVSFGPREVPVGGCPWTISEAGQPAIPLPDTDDCPLGERIRCDVEKVVQEHLADYPGYGFSSDWERKGSILLSNPTDHEVEDVIQMPNGIKDFSGFVICFSRTDADGTPHEYSKSAFMFWRPTDAGHDFTILNYGAFPQ